MNVGVTGPQQLEHLQKLEVARLVKTMLATGDVLVSGVAHGVDSVAVIAAVVSKHHVILTVPGDLKHNINLVSQTRRHGKGSIIKCESDYMLRNDKTIELSDTLLAFPETREEQLRSGTWATIRRARKKGIEVKLFPLDELEI